MSSLFSSRKFLILLLDAVFGLAALFVAFFLVEAVETQILIVSAFAIIQPVFVGVINGITKEDEAAYLSGSHPNS